MALHRYIQFLVCVTFLLVIAGGLVTSTGSGLAVPDWPLSYGQLMPPMVGGIRYEHTHRIIASFVGLMTLGLTVWTLSIEKRRWVRWLAIAAFGAVVLQGILGGLTVLYLLPAPISIFHACLAQTFLALIVSLGFVTSREWMAPASASVLASVPFPAGTGLATVDLNKNLSRNGSGTALKRLLFLSAGFIYLQLILGAAIRHTHFDVLVIPHIIVAFLVLVHVSLALTHVLKNHEAVYDDCFAAKKKLTRPAIGLAFLTLFQMSLGMGAFVYRIMLAQTPQPTFGRIFFLTAHQVLGSVLLATAVFFILRVLRMEKTK